MRAQCFQINEPVVGVIWPDVQEASWYDGAAQQFGSPSSRYKNNSEHVRPLIMRKNHVLRPAERAALRSRVVQGSCTRSPSQRRGEEECRSSKRKKKTPSLWIDAKNREKSGGNSGNCDADVQNEEKKPWT